MPKCIGSSVHENQVPMSNLLLRRDETHGVSLGSKTNNNAFRQHTSCCPAILVTLIKFGKCIEKSQRSKTVVKHKNICLSWLPVSKKMLIFLLTPPQCLLNNLTYKLTWKWVKAIFIICMNRAIEKLLMHTHRKSINPQNKSW